jgi:hypothetical protein
MRENEHGQILTTYKKTHKKNKLPTSNEIKKYPKKKKNLCNANQWHNRQQRNHPTMHGVTKAPPNLSGPKQLIATATHHQVFHYSPPF